LIDLNNEEVEKEIYNNDGSRRLVIVRRTTGTFYYRQEHFLEDRSENCWVPSRQNKIGVYGTSDEAEREARSNVDWLSD
jgi:hypothetical protein